MRIALFSLRLLLALALFVAYSDSCMGFALLGPYADWMQNTNGYRAPSDIGGPMALNEEYRWNVPCVSYAFDDSFLDYFGSNGVAAVESAISLLNDLPPASSMVLTNYPLDVWRFNYTATAQRLFDLKSAVLALLLEHIGLAEPSRHIFNLRRLDPSFEYYSSEYWPPGTIPEYVLERNYDPGTLAASHSVNGNLYVGLVQQYGFQLLTTVNGFYFIPTTDVVETLKDFYDDTSLSAVADWKSAFPAGQGLCCVGLTRDDVGGLRYLLSSRNVNLEELLPDVHGAGGERYVKLALRPGVEKVTFVKRDYDSIRGRLSSPWSYKFRDAYFSTEIQKQHRHDCREQRGNDCHCPCSTNLVLRHQELERVASQPDFLFSATNLSRALVRPEYVTTGTSNWWNSAVVDHTTALGPGLIRPPVRITFDRRGPSLQTADYYRFPSWLYGDLSLSSDTRWGSFDVSTNPPVTFPQTAPASRTNHVTVRLWIHQNDSPLPDAAFATFVWHEPATVGAKAIMQTSSNLTDWVSVRTNDVSEGPIDWNHFRFNDRTFFRVQVR